MKLAAGVLLVISFSTGVFGSDLPCDVLGTSKDPNIIKLINSGPSTPQESLASYRDQYADSLRCNKKSDAARYKMYIEGLEDAIARDNAKKGNGPTTAVKADSAEIKKPAKAILPAVVKKISISCDDEATKPKTPFKIMGTDTDGVVMAEGYKDQMLVRLSFDNRKPELGRVIEVIVNGESNKMSLYPGLGPIGFKPGFAMKLLLKAIGLNSDLKINCFPLSQTVIAEPTLEVAPTKIVNDSSRDATKPAEVMVPEGKNGSDPSSVTSK